MRKRDFDRLDPWQARWPVDRIEAHIAAISRVITAFQRAAMPTLVAAEHARIATLGEAEKEQAEKDLQWTKTDRHPYTYLGAPRKHLAGAAHALTSAWQDAIERTDIAAGETLVLDPTYLLPGVTPEKVAALENALGDAKAALPQIMRDFAGALFADGPKVQVASSLWLEKLPAGHGAAQYALKFEPFALLPERPIIVIK